MTFPFELLLSIVGYFVLGALAAVPLIQGNVWLAPHFSLFDWPKARGMVDERIPIIGYSLVALAMVASVVSVGFSPVRPWLLVTSLVIAVMGHLDDRRSLPAWAKMLIQVSCVAIMVTMDQPIRAAMVETYGWWGILWTGFFILGLTNAINFVDGIDGLAGVCLFVGSLGYLVFTWQWGTGQEPVVVPSIIMGSLIPFFYFNVIKRKGFLGNVGSYFFSYLLAILHLSLPIPAEYSISRASISGLCFLVPIADSLLVISMRLLSMRSPFQADKGHLHHRLIQTALPLRFVLLNFALIEMTGLGVAGILGYHIPSLRTPLPVLLCISHAVLAAVLIFLVEKASRRRLQYFFLRLDTGQPLYFMKYVLSTENGLPIGTHIMRRVEALVSAEIRVTDFCFTDGLDTLFISLGNEQRAADDIHSRLQYLFRREHIHAALIVEEGEFLKVPYSTRTASTSPRAASGPR